MLCEDIFIGRVECQLDNVIFTGCNSAWWHHGQGKSKYWFISISATDPLIWRLAVHILSYHPSCLDLPIRWTWHQYTYRTHFTHTGLHHHMTVCILEELPRFQHPFYFICSNSFASIDLVALHHCRNAYNHHTPYCMKCCDQWWFDYGIHCHWQNPFRHQIHLLWEAIWTSWVKQ